MCMGAGASRNRVSLIRSSELTWITSTLLQQRQFLLGAPPSPSATPRLDRFHRCVNLSLPAYTPCPEFKGDTAVPGTA